MGAGAGWSCWVTEHPLLGTFISLPPRLLDISAPPLYTPTTIPHPPPGVLGFEPLPLEASGNVTV